MAMRARASGLSLIELLVAVAILGILVTIATLSVDAVGAGRKVEREAHRLQALIELACERAQLSGHDQGVHAMNHGYAFSQWMPNGWRVESIGELRPRTIEAGLQLSLRRADLTLELADTPSPEPQLVCFAAGELTPFVVEIGAGPAVPRFVVRGEVDGSVVAAALDKP
jgi:general secretion pathway protein H